MKYGLGILPHLLERGDMGNFLEILHPVTAVVHWKVIDILSKYDIETVLDVGGVGKLGKLSDYKVKDANVKMGFDGQELPFDDNKFDAVVSIATLEHVDDYEKFLKECYRAAKKVTVHWFPCGMYAREAEGLKKKYSHHHSCSVPMREEITRVSADTFKCSDLYNFIQCGEHLLLCMTLSESLRVPEVYDYVLKFYHHNYGVMLIGEK